jgi:branched-chain amino acid transport system substrate-binding protein
MCSGAAIPASKVYNEEGIVFISPAATNPDLTDQRLDNVFRVCGRDDQQGMVLGEHIAKHYKGKNVAILHDKTAYGRGVADEVKRVINAKGIQEKFFESVSRGERD